MTKSNQLPIVSEPSPVNSPPADDLPVTAPSPYKPSKMEIFRSRFRAWLAFWVVTLAIGYMYAATFIPVAAEAKHTGTILGFLTGTAVAMVLSFYYSGSEGRETSDLKEQIKLLEKQLGEMTKPKT